MRCRPNWTTDEAIRHKISKAWAKGDILRMAAAQDGPTALEFKVTGPTVRELTDDFAAARTWAASLGTGMPYEIRRELVPNRLHGTQQMPATVVVTPATALAVLDMPIGLLDQFIGALRLIDTEAPHLRGWAMQEPVKVLSLVPDLPGLLSAINWLASNPRPDIYLRQMTAPGVHTKLMERHRSTLAALLDMTLPATAINSDHTGAEGFTARYGFKDQPVQVRFRSLDPTIQVIPGHPGADLALDAATFAALDLPAVRHVVITENKTNYLSLPELEASIAIFGAGYCWQALAGAAWLHSKDILYWGDIDTHGLTILSELRRHFPHARSVLMDMATAQASRAIWGREENQAKGTPSNLTEEALQVYRALTSAGEMQGIRVEQEHLYFDQAVQVISAAIR